jgi:hypothetical protein
MSLFPAMPLAENEVYSSRYVEELKTADPFTQISPSSRIPSSRLRVPDDFPNLAAWSPPLPPIRSPAKTPRLLMGGDRHAPAKALASFKRIECWPWLSKPAVPSGAAALLTIARYKAALRAYEFSRSIRRSGSHTCFFPGSLTL